MDMLKHLPDNIRWLGQVPQERLAQIFRFNDIFVLPSYFEGLPLVLIEAMASGMVPVSTDLPGIRPWIETNVPGQNVRFVPMPEMETIDTPTPEGRAKFRDDLITVLKSLITDIADDGSALPHPDTSGISWDGVAKKIITFI
jgi:glycosyltransferase involved in cell wall biosynthesis